MSVERESGQHLGVLAANTPDHRFGDEVDRLAHPVGVRSVGTEPLPIGICGKLEQESAERCEEEVSPSSTRTCCYRVRTTFFVMRGRWDPRGGRNLFPEMVPFVPDEDTPPKERPSLPGEAGPLKEISESPSSMTTAGRARTLSDIACNPGLSASGRWLEGIGCLSRSRCRQPSSWALLALCSASRLGGPGSLGRSSGPVPDPWATSCWARQE